MALAGLGAVIGAEREPAISKVKQTIEDPKLQAAIDEGQNFLIATGQTPSPNFTFDPESGHFFPNEPSVQSAQARAFFAKRASAEASATARRRQAGIRRGQSVGRKSTILTSSRGVEEQLGSVGRPGARAATNLGG